ncbi:MAG: ferritin-like domain-containing protein [Burkholderiales bacterium]|nr:ferritin-like domain-containing protein [Burkholderiales bacterium]MDE2456341.1 ferritin-like domain-containing protein [Burkholderiales bacterium]
MRNPLEANAPRRRGFIGTGVLGLSAGTLALLAGAPARAAGTDPAKDSGILNVALGLEHEAIAAYQIGAESGLLQKNVLDIALLFQSHHKAHRDALMAAIRTLGGTPVQGRSIAQYAQAMQAARLKSQQDVLRLAGALELGAAKAYLGVIPAFSDPTLAGVAGRVAADETMHWTALAGALGQSLPANALSFGA